MSQSDLSHLWEEHTSHEFVTRDTEATLATMVEDAYVNHVPVMTGGFGKSALREFYSQRFIPKMPPDTTLTPVSRTIGEDQLVDEMIFSFTHTQEMPWMLPGVPPTNKRVEIPLVAIVRFREGKLAHEHIYWDQLPYSNRLDSLRTRDCRCSELRLPVKSSTRPTTDSESWSAESRGLRTAC